MVSLIEWYYLNNRSFQSSGLQVACVMAVDRTRFALIIGFKCHSEVTGVWKGSQELEKELLPLALFYKTMSDFCFGGGMKQQNIQLARFKL